MDHESIKSLVPVNLALTYVKINLFMAQIFCSFTLVRGCSIPAFAVDVALMSGRCHSNGLLARSIVAFGERPANIGPAHTILPTNF